MEERELKLKILKLAKEYLIADMRLWAMCRGLCSYILRAILNVYEIDNLGIVFNKYAEDIFPEFKSVCRKHGGQIGLMFYWRLSDTQSRLKVLDELISIYSEQE